MSSQRIKTQEGRVCNACGVPSSLMRCGSVIFQLGPSGTQPWDSGHRYKHCLAVLAFGI